MSTVKPALIKLLAVPVATLIAVENAPHRALDRARPIFWEHEGNKAVRDGKWKLVQKWRGPWELYDMDADRTELNNLIDAHPDVAAKLETAWNDWLKRAFVDEWTGPDHTNWGQDIKPGSAQEKSK